MEHLARLDTQGSGFQFDKVQHTSDRWTKGLAVLGIVLTASALVLLGGR